MIKFEFTESIIFQQHIDINSDILRKLRYSLQASWHFQAWRLCFKTSRDFKEIVMNNRKPRSSVSYIYIIYYYFTSANPNVIYSILVAQKNCE